MGKKGYNVLCRAPGEKIWTPVRKYYKTKSPAKKRAASLRKQGFKVKIITAPGD